MRGEKANYGRRIKEGVKAASGAMPESSDTGGGVVSPGIPQKKLAEPEGSAKFEQRGFTSRRRVTERSQSFTVIRPKPEDLS
jgi:hypothetical protein